MHKKQIGNIAEFAVGKELSQQGLPIFKELGDLTKVDLITILDSKPITIQVKHAGEAHSKGCAVVRLTKSGPNGYYFRYSKNDFQILAAYLPVVDKVCYFNWNDIQDSQEMNIRYERTNQKVGIRWYEDFLDFKKAAKST